MEGPNSRVTLATAGDNESCLRTSMTSKLPREKLPCLARNIQERRLSSFAMTRYTSLAMTLRFLSERRSWMLYPDLLS